MSTYLMSNRRRKRHKKMLAGGLIIAAFLALGIWFFMLGEKSHAPSPPAGQNTQPSEETAPPPEQPKPPLVNLQPTVDAWAAKQKGEYALMVYDPANKQIIATHNADEQYFAASIYKLSVAYLALMDVQAGKHSFDEPFRGEWSRKKCIDEMIRSSDSPCAESILAEIGQAEANSRLQALGLTGKTFPGFTITASDVMVILQRLQERRDLNEASTSILLDAMKHQIYRNGMPKGVPEATVADKVGFSETPHYHDVGIITLPNGREYLVVFLSQGAGSRQAADFASTIYSVLKN